MELKFDKSEMKNEKSQRNEKSQLATSKSNTTIEETTYSGVEKQTQQQKKSQVQKFSYTKDNKESAETNTKENKQKRLAFDIAHAAQEAIINHDQVATVKSTKNSPSIAKINTAAAKKEAAVVQEHSSNTSYEATSVYESHVTTSSSQTQHYKTEEVISGPIYTKQDNLSFPELEKIAQQEPPPALPPKTKNMHSPSRHVFSPTESIESNGAGTASVKTVEFIPVKEKIKMIAAQQEELNRKEVERESQSKTQSQSEHKQKGVRILPPSPVTVRKMMVEEELQNYDTAVTRTTPVMMDSPVTKMVESRNLAMETSIKQEMSRQQVLRKEESLAVPGWNSPAAAELLEKVSAKYDVDQAFDQLVAESVTPTSMIQSQSFSSQLTQSSQSQQTSSSSQIQQVSTQKQFSSSSSSQQVHQSSSVAHHQSMSAAEECRRSFEEAELEAMALESVSTQSHQTFSKQSSVVETGSVQSFVYQEGASNNMISKQRSNSITRSEKQNNNSEDISRSRKTLRSPGPFVRSPDTFNTVNTPQSAPATPMSQRRRLRINQSPKPIESENNKPNYREHLKADAFQPGFYRPPPEDASQAPMFQLMKGRSRSNVAIKEESVRMSQTSSTAYEGDSEL